MMLREEKERKWEERYGEELSVKLEEDRLEEVLRREREERAASERADRQGKADGKERDEGKGKKEVDETTVPSAPGINDLQITDSTPHLFDTSPPTSDPAPSSDTATSSLKPLTAVDSDVIPEPVLGPGPESEQEHSPWKIKKIEIELESNDQGWSDARQLHGKCSYFDRRDDLTPRGTATLLLKRRMTGF